jgi:hypothetical protein
MMMDRKIHLRFHTVYYCMEKVPEEMELNNIQVLVHMDDDVEEVDILRAYSSTDEHVDGAHGADGEEDEEDDEVVEDGADDEEVLEDIHALAALETPFEEHFLLPSSYHYHQIDYMSQVLQDQKLHFHLYVHHLLVH